MENYKKNIGRKCRKSAFKPGVEPKPFKSGNKVNTIKGVINHPILNIPAYTFEEDDSYVECRRCATYGMSTQEYEVLKFWINIALDIISEKPGMREAKEAYRFLKHRIDSGINIFENSY